MKKIFTALFVAACAVGLAAGELKIVKATYGNGDQVNDVTEKVQSVKWGMPGVFLLIRPNNQMFGGDPAPRKAKVLTVTCTDGGEEKIVQIPERQLGLVVADAVPAQEFKLLRGFYGSGSSWKEVTPQLLQVLENKTSLGINNTTLGPDPAPRKKKELLVVYTQENKIQFLLLPERTNFSVDSFKK